MPQTDFGSNTKSPGGYGGSYSNAVGNGAGGINNGGGAHSNAGGYVGNWKGAGANAFGNPVGKVQPTRNVFADLNAIMGGGKGQPMQPAVNQPVAAVPPIVEETIKPRPRVKPPVTGQPISGYPIEPVAVSDLGGLAGYVRNPDGTYSQYRPTAGYPTPPSSFNPNPSRFAGNVADYRNVMRGYAGDGYTGW